MAGLLDNANKAALKAAGTNMAWDDDQVLSTEVPQQPPLTNGVGLSCLTAVKGLVALTCREVPGARTARLSISSYDTSADYTVTVGGTPEVVVAASHTTAAQALDTLKTDLEGNGTIAALVDIVALDSAGVDSSVSGNDTASLRIRGKAEADFSIDFTATAGTVLATADAVSAAGEVMVRFGGDSGTRPDRWVADGQVGSMNSGTRGVIKALDVRSFAEIMIVVSAVGKDGSDGSAVIARCWRTVGCMTDSQL